MPEPVVATGHTLLFRKPVCEQHTLRGYLSWQQQCDIPTVTALPGTYHLTSHER